MGDREIAYAQTPNEYRNAYRQLVSGDSGHPVFAVINGELILVATHTSPRAGPNYSSFWNQDLIRQAMDQMK